MPRQTAEQKERVSRVMHEWKHGELESSRGGKVKNPRQAVAIALSESGSSDRQSPARKRRALSRTKAKERHGETAQQQKEGRHAIDSKEPTQAVLYREAKRRGIAGRSRMTKRQLQRTLAS